MTLTAGEQYSGGEVRDANGRMVVALDPSSSVVIGGSTASPLTGTTTTFLPLPTGVAATDTANLNTVLARGGRIRPNPLSLAAAYSLTAPLVTATGGNTDVDFGGCTFTLTGQFNMLQNAAVSPAVTATDAVTTVGSSVVTSTALAAVAQAGQALAVVGAGPPGGNGGGACWMYGTVLSVNAGAHTITLTGNVKGVAASVAVSGATAYLFNRDSNVTVSGGTWDAASIWTLQATRIASGVDSHQIRFRRVDGLKASNIALKMADWGGQGKGWAFGVNPGDCTDFAIDNVTATNASTCVQGDGPLARGRVTNCRGLTQDDMVAFGCVGFQGNDVEGDVTDIEINGVQSNGSWTAVKFFAGQGGNSVQRFLTATARSVKGTTQQSPVNVVDYAGAGAGPMSIQLDDVTCNGGTGFLGITNSATYGQVSKVSAVDFQASYSGLLLSSFDSADAASTFQPGAGFTYYVMLRCPAQVVVTNMELWLVTIGATLTAGANWAGIYDANGALRLKSADQASAWTSGANAMKVIALTAQGAFTSTLPGGPGVFYWAAILANGTTTPVWAGKTSQVQVDPGFVNGTIPGPRHRVAFSHTGSQTTLGASIAGNQIDVTNVKQTPWIACT